MNVKVVYHSMTGNTKKVADTIAESMGTSAQTAGEARMDGTVDMLFIGDGVYGGNADVSTQKFIQSLTPDKVKNAAVFGTYGGQKKALTKMQGMLRERGINVLDESFGCKGKCWFIINRRHPDSEDLRKAQEFAARAVGRI